MNAAMRLFCQQIAGELRRQVEHSNRSVRGVAVAAAMPESTLRHKLTTGVLTVGELDRIASVFGLSPAELIHSAETAR